VKTEKETDMKTSIWIVTTTIPERGEPPCFPSPFATETEAEAYADEMMRAEWASHGPDDDETGESLPYPGDWREAQDLILDFYNDGSWGQWQVTQHTIETPDVSHPAAAFINRMAQFTTPEDEFNDPENQDNVAVYSDVEEYISDMSDDRLCGEYEAFMCMVREARTIRDATPAPDPRITEAKAVIGQLVLQVEQMRGMFDDSDGTIQAALDDAEAWGND
jgi:hypothetical protein